MPEHTYAAGGRCRMQGGASLRGEAHPRYKHGKYSKYRPIDIDDLIAHYATMPDLLLDFEPVDLGALLAEVGRLDLVLQSGATQKV